MQTVKKSEVLPIASAENVRKSRREIISLKAKAAMKRAWPEIAADWLANSFGTVMFLFLNVALFTVWLSLNSGMIKSATPFDPFPFNLLTTVVSLEAIFLSIIVLISQNRASRLDELRQEIDLQVDTISEQEITKIMEMLTKIMHREHLSTSGDSALKQMLKPTDREKIEKELGGQV